MNQTVEGSTPRISLLRQETMHACQTRAREWEAENASHYTALLCLKPIASRRRINTVETAYDMIAERITDSYEEVVESQREFLCVLPPGHTGRCTHTPHKKLITNSVVSCKLDWIYTTPGDDDYVYKNRCSRLFPIVVSDELEKQWRDKRTKLKCAIPLREASTPLLMASAYLDYITLLLRVEGIDAYLRTGGHLPAIRTVVAAHADHLAAHYARFNRRIFDDEGFSICPVMTDRIEVAHLANGNINVDTAVQLGHVVPRSESEFTIRGKNILLMSREGNRFVGDKVFTEDEWINRMRRVIAGQSLRSTHSSAAPSQ